MKREDELPEFRAWIRTLPCSLCKDFPPNDGHHVRSVGAGGVDERNVIPVCRICHSKIHQYGRIRVEGMLRVDFEFLADQVWSLWTQMEVEVG